MTVCFAMDTISMVQMMLAVYLFWKVTIKEFGMDLLINQS
jgi:hypothetical protein